MLNFAYQQKVAVIGLGYVGLPLLILAAHKGYSVLGIDLDKERIASLKKGKSYNPEISDNDLQTIFEKDLIKVSTDYSELPSCDVIVVCVHTPLSSDRKPDYSYLVNAVREIAFRLRQGQLIIVESTVAPGTTSTLVQSHLQTCGFVAGTHYFLSYSPERIDPGNKEFKLNTIPKLVAGFTPTCQLLANKFYDSLGLTVVPVRTLATAEMAKLLENTYRDINIALVNEMAQVCRTNNINIWEVINAAATKPFGFQAFYPGPGVGGHCVPVDSVYYTSWARESGTPAKLAELARKVNAEMPQYVTSIIRQTLAATNKIISGSKILVLGVTYKKDTDDVRESSIIKLIDQLQVEGAQVSFHDPLVESINTNSTELQRITLNVNSISQQDCVVLAIAHSAYNMSWLYSVSPVMIDLTNAMADYPNNKLSKL
ncbi:MAG: nucleotide sugar dehydrogenase [Clostridiales bacterium]|nr:nucleotide sugar dehydrogenase [Clostridiales bacterium]